MVVCPYCGKENNQPDAAYCLYCGSSLQQAQSAASPTFSSTSRSPVIGQGYGTPGGMSSSSSSSSSTTLSFELSERYQKALKRVEQLGYVVVALAVITLALLLSIAF
jgi:zinc-ribbon domain